MRPLADRARFELFSLLSQGLGRAYSACLKLAGYPGLRSASFARAEIGAPVLEGTSDSGASISQFAAPVRRLICRQFNFGECFGQVFTRADLFRRNQAGDRKTLFEQYERNIFPMGAIYATG